LGIVHEATLRTHAIPEQTLAVRIGMDDPTCLDPLLSDWVVGDAAPAWLLMGNPDGRWMLHAGYCGRDVATNAQSRALKMLIDKAPGLHWISPATRELGASLQDLTADRAWMRQATALVKLIVPPAATGRACRALAAVDPSLRIMAMPVHGCLFAGGLLSSETTRQLEAAALEAVASVGIRVWHQRPPSCEDLPPFSPHPSDLLMMSRLKQVMDPKFLFNRGRLIPVEGVVS
jgi:hypothetical protein